MKLSEAIALGSTMITNTSGTFLVGSLETATEGCAFGMAMKALNKNQITQDDFPVMNTIAKYPCGCNFSLQQTSMINVVMHMNDAHVCGDREWTLSQLIDWVAQLEKEFDAALCVYSSSRIGEAGARAKKAEAVKQKEPIAEAVMV